MVTRVCVVGAGVVGMTTAVNVVERVRDVTVTVIADRFGEQTTSDVAAGLCFPHLVGDTSPALVREWGDVTYDYFLSLFHSPDAAAAGVSLLSGYMMYTDIPACDYSSKLMGFHVMTAAELSHFGSTYTSGVTFTTTVAECRKFLPWLEKRFEMNGGKIEKRKIYQLRELFADYDIIVNCTGIGAKRLVKDDQLVSVRGQLIRVDAPWIKHFYIINDGDNYIIPCVDSVVLGGTHQVGDWSLDAEPTDRRAIWDACVQFMPSLQAAKVLEDRVGLRPSRPRMRLERETVQEGSKIVHIIHNYGHGGAGVSLSWGCALHACRLVNECLPLDTP